MTDPLLAWRPQFPVLDRTVYMISHSLGAMPRRARQRLNEFADMWDSRSIRAWEEGWWEMPREVGNLVARIIGAGEGEVVMQQNVSIATWIALSCFDWNTSVRKKIVTEELNFPSNLYILHEAERLGARLHRVPSGDGMTMPLDRMLDAIDDETALVAVSHVLFKSSYVQDVTAIARRAQQVGARVLVDIYQAAGSVPVDVRAWGVDFATGGSVKWLCGGPGGGYLYVRRDLWPVLRPRLTGWMAHRNPFAFDPGPQQFGEDIYRFMHGTPHIPCLYSARSGYEIILEAGVENIRRKSQRQTERLIAAADAAGFPVKSPRNPAERGGTVVLDVPHGKEVVAELSRRDVLMDYRPGAGIRVAPHFYTTDEEVDTVIRQIAAVQEEITVAAS